MVARTQLVQKIRAALSVRDEARAEMDALRARARYVEDEEIDAVLLKMKAALDELARLEDEARKMGLLPKRTLH